MKSIILASKSEVRKKILDENQIECTVEPSNLDEEEIDKQIEYLELNGYIEVDYNSKFIRMTDLPKKTQNKAKQQKTRTSIKE